MSNYKLEFKTQNKKVIDRAQVDMVYVNYLRNINK